MTDEVQRKRSVPFEAVTSIVISLVALFIAWQQLGIQESLNSIQEEQSKISKDIKDREEFTLVLELVGSTEPERSRIGALLIGPLSPKNALIREFELPLLEYAGQIDDETRANILIEEIVQAAADDPDRRQQVEQVISQFPLRIFLHIRNEEQRRCADSIRQRLDRAIVLDRTIDVQSDVRMVTFGPSRSELRILKKNDVETAGPLAERLTEALSEVCREGHCPSDPLISINDKSSEFDSRKDVRRGTYEVWLDPVFSC